MIIALLTGVFPVVAASAQELLPLKDLPLSRLEQRLTEIDTELAGLARYSLRSGTGVIGYHSRFHEDEFHREWIQINFEAEHPLDEVVLVPVIRRDTQTGFQADGFPKNFRLIAGTANDPVGQVLAEYTDEPSILPRIAPLAIPCEGVMASWVRLEADRLCLRAFDERFVLQLSEIMVFSHQENVALHQTVTSKSNRRDGLAWGERFVVDGFVPYLMDAAEGKKSVAFVARIASNALPSLTIDLGTCMSVSRLHLHAIETSDFLPQALTSDFGTPRRMYLEGANEPDFSDAETVITLDLDSTYQTSPIMAWTFPEVSKRYFRLNIVAPGTDPLSPARAARVGFAEIELFSKGKNVALGKTTTASGMQELTRFRRSLNALTDGHNIYGTILPMRDWMNELARRHDLETERPSVLAELNRRYARQKQNLTRMKWLAALLGAGGLFTLLLDRILRMQEVTRIRERFAADLHDELGANLHTIGLLSDLAEQSRDDPRELSMLHQRIRAVTERTHTAMHHCTALQEASALYAGLRADMERAAQRIMAKLQHDIRIEGEEYIEQLKPRTRMDLFLFYKECLVNISRHSGATEFATHVQASPREIHLTVSDNGHGIETSQGNGVPKSLKRRARLLGARITVDGPATGGTCVTLKLETRKWGLRR